MKKYYAPAAFLLAALMLTGCGKKTAKPTEAPTIPILMVETETAAAPTEPEETRKIAAFTEPTAAPTEPPETKPAEKPEKKDPETRPPETTEAPKTAPVITKNPTGETVKAGDQTWFIAHADGDEGVRWWFNPPEGGRGKSPREIMEAMPGLKVELLPEDTLGVSNIPQDLNGWLIQAEFYNNFGNSWSNGAKVTVEPDLSPEEILEAYNPVMQNCLYIRQYDGDAGQVDTALDPYELIGSREILQGSLGYALKDLNGDNLPELLIGNPDADDLVAALFTLEDGKPVKVFSGWARNRYYLHTSGRLLHESSSGAANSSASVCVLEHSKLRMLECAWSTDQSGEQKFYYSDSGKAEISDKNEVSAQQYEETTERMRLNKLPLPDLKSLS